MISVLGADAFLLRSAKCYSDDTHPWKAPERHLGAREASARLSSAHALDASLAMRVFNQCIPAAECCPLSYKKQVYFILTGRLRSLRAGCWRILGGHFLVCNWLSFYCVSNGRRVNGLSGFPLVRALRPFMRALLPGPSPCHMPDCLITSLGG